MLLQQRTLHRRAFCSLLGSGLIAGPVGADTGSVLRNGPTHEWALGGETAFRPNPQPAQPPAGSESEQRRAAERAPVPVEPGQARLRMVVGDDSLDVVFRDDDRYFPNALRTINRFMRDRRDGTVLPIDVRVIEMLARTQRTLGTNRPFQLISGARSQATNEWLIRRSIERNGRSGVARNSRHLRGEAGDVRMAGVSIPTLAQAARAADCGGIGRYSGSNFVHIDCGPRRSWGT